MTSKELPIDFSKLMSSPSSATKIITGLHAHDMAAGGQRNYQVENDLLQQQCYALEEQVTLLRNLNQQLTEALHEKCQALDALERTHMMCGEVSKLLAEAARQQIEGGRGKDRVRKAGSGSGKDEGEGAGTSDAEDEERAETETCGSS